MMLHSPTSGFYAIVDPEHCGGRDPLWVANDILQGGCCALQLRFKQNRDSHFLELARQMKRLCSKAQVPFVVNDRADIAVLSHADGLHLGQQDLPIEKAREIFDGFIGLSTHNLDQVKTANTLGPDYIGFGPVFSTTTKENADPTTGLKRLAEALSQSKVPVVAIGGVHLENLHRVLEYHPPMIACVSVTCDAPAPHQVASTISSSMAS